jgi:serine/threonine protein kinase
MPTANQLLQQGRYRITQPCEPNAPEKIYKAFDEAQKTEVVLKEIPVRVTKVLTAAQQEKMRQDFAAEAQKLIEIRHEAFQPVLDYFSEIDRQYLVLESVDGDSLAQLIERNKTPFALSDVANWAEQLLDALAHLHRQTPPVIHRDIKPQNIKLALDGKVKLDVSNLGKASPAKIGGSVTNQNLHFLPLELIWERLDSASQKVILNSFDEKSEEILKQPADARTDIYALGATIYYLLTARLPVDALERSIDLLEDKPDPLVPPARLNPKISPEISDAVMKALAIRRENRFDSAAIMRQVWRTAFLRTKEREAEEAKNKSAASVVKIGEQDILEIEAEPIPQVDLIKRLQEAEARRREAERRAAEAEKKLQEKEAKNIENTELSAIFKETPKPAAPTPKTVPAESVKTAPAVENFSTENGVLFAETPKQSGSWKIAVATGALLVFGGAAFGVWSFMKAPGIAPNQAVTNQLNTSSETPNPAPPEETAPTPNVQPTAEIADTAIETAPGETASPTAVSAPAGRNRSGVAPVAPKAQKPVAPTAKPATPEKKKLTVDDLINDN